MVTMVLRAGLWWRYRGWMKGGSRGRIAGHRLSCFLSQEEVDYDEIVIHGTAGIGMKCWRELWFSQRWGWGRLQSLNMASRGGVL